MSLPKDCDPVMSLLKDCDPVTLILHLIYVLCVLYVCVMSLALSKVSTVADSYSMCICMSHVCLADSYSMNA